MKDGVYGSFTPNRNSKTLNISESIVKELESAKDFDAVTCLFVTAVTILHESAHYGDDLAGNPNGAKEDGEVFENLAYGKVITKSNAKEHLIKHNNKMKQNKDNDKQENEPDEP